MNKHTLIAAASVAAIVLPTFAAAGGGVTFFTGQGAFEDAASGAGKFLKGTEDFEESTMAPNNVFAIDDPLNASSDNDWFNPGDIEANLQVQSNVGGANSAQTSPHGVQGLAAASAGFAGAVSDIVLANFFVEALDLMFLKNDKTAVGFNTLNHQQTSVLRVDVYNTSNVLIGTTTTAANITGSNFLGVLADGDFIGRINIFEMTGTGAEGADNIQMWTAIPEPGTFIALGVGLAMLAGLRRRK